MNHVIRLRGPWEFVLVRCAAGSPPPTAETGKQSLPADWSATCGAGFRGAVCYRRVFHRPTGLEDGQPVWLAVAGVSSSAKVSLNQQSLGSVEADGGRFAVERLLQDTNVLEVTVTHDAGPQPGGLTGLVTLEIETVRPRPVD